MKLLWTEQAFLKLRAIKSYIEKQSSKKVATHFIEKIIEKAETLTAFPERGRIVPEMSSVHIRELMEGRYRIIYRLTQERVEILTVFEGHKLLERKELEKSSQADS